MGKMTNAQKNVKTVALIFLIEAFIFGFIGAITLFYHFGEIISLLPIVALLAIIVALICLGLTGKKKKSVAIGVFVCSIVAIVLLAVEYLLSKNEGVSEIGLIVCCGVAGLLLLVMILVIVLLSMKNKVVEAEVAPAEEVVTESVVEEIFAETPRNDVPVQEKTTVSSPRSYVSYKPLSFPDPFKGVPIGYQPLSLATLPEYLAKNASHLPQDMVESAYYRPSLVGNCFFPVAKPVRKPIDMPAIRQKMVVGVAAPILPIRSDDDDDDDFGDEDF